MKIYVGNLPFDVTEDEIKALFAPYGNVETVNVITDKYSGRSKGFAFVEMPVVAEAQAAINGLNGKMLKERPVTVSAARPREERSGSSYGSRGGGGGYDRGGGRGGGRRY